MNSFLKKSQSETMAENFLKKRIFGGFFKTNLIPLADRVFVNIAFISNTAGDV